MQENGADRPTAPIAPTDPPRDGNGMSHWCRVTVLSAVLVVWGHELPSQRSVPVTLDVVCGGSRRRSRCSCCSVPSPVPAAAALPTATTAAAAAVIATVASFPPVRPRGTGPRLSAAAAATVPWRTPARPVRPASAARVPASFDPTSAPTPAPTPTPPSTGPSTFTPTPTPTPARPSAPTSLWWESRRDGLQHAGRAHSHQRGHDAPGYALDDAAPDGRRAPDDRYAGSRPSPHQPASAFGEMVEGPHAWARGRRVRPDRAVRTMMVKRLTAMRHP